MIRTLLGLLNRAARLRVLAMLYRRGQRRKSTVEAADPSILRLGERLRAECLAANRDRFRGSPWRVLLCTPPSLAADVWFSDLAAGMQHTALPYRRLEALQQVDGPLLDDFRPNVVIALDSDRALACIDFEALGDYKQRHGCLRLFIPTRDDIFTAGDALSAGEARRLRLAVDGESADAFISLYEPEVFQRGHRAWAEAGFTYVALPQSGNPIEDYPRDVPRTQDYFYASVCTAERLRATWAGLRPILSGYHGDWAGLHWGFGSPMVPYDEMPARYGASRIVLSPLLRPLRTFPMELTHRVFEAAACGACQLSTLSPVTRRYFSPDALVCARDDDEFERLFVHYLHRPDERSRHAERAVAELYAAHTVFHRIERLLADLERLSNRL